MIRFLPWLLAAVLLAGGGWKWRDLSADLAEARAALADAEAEARVAREAAAQRAEAAAVAQAHTRRLAEEAAEYTALREWILRRDDDAPIPDLLRDALDRLFARPPR